VVALSSALLPTFRVFLVLLILVALIIWLLKRSFIRVYSKAQVALQETLSQPPPSRHDTPARALPSLLREADLETLTIHKHSPANGKFIRELQLRTQTGASIVGIERSGSSVINPGPDEELLAGDQILLLGTRQQLDRAKDALGSFNSHRG